MGETSTYFRDFRQTRRGSAFELAVNFAEARNALGHNIEVVRVERGVEYRVYFSPRFLDLANARIAPFSSEDQ